MFKLPNLPFEMNALEPYISKETLEYHYNKHHQSYVDNLNKLISWTEFENMDLEEIIKKSNWVIFNNAAQVWNHTFYWNCLWKKSNSEPSWKLKELIKINFWTFENFKNEFFLSATTNFWSWWTWLVLTPENKLKIVSTSNAKNPLTTDDKPLLVIDIWEHAYYIDYRNARPKYIENFWNIVNWDNIKI